MSFSLSERELEFNKWKVTDLRKELKARGLSVEGKKNELVERLQLAVGDSALLEDSVNDNDEILDEDVLTDDEAFEDSELTKSDSPEKNNENSDKVELGIKRKTNDTIETTAKQPKKVILNRSISVNHGVVTTEGKENQVKKTSDISSGKPNVVQVGSLSSQERLERRAAKFGVAMSNEAKKEARAARFGLPTAASKIGGLVNTNIDVLKKRAERFGTTLPGSILESAEIEEKRKKREERFGKVEKITSAPTYKGKYSFQSSDMSERKKLRAERFKIKQ